MTIRFPDLNTNAFSSPPIVSPATANSLALVLADTASVKPANTAYMLGMFLMVRPGGARDAAQRNWEQVIWGRRNASSSGGDAGLYLGAENRSVPASNNVLRCTFGGSSTTVGQPNPINLLNHVPYFVALIANSTGAWIAACPCGGTAQVQALTSPTTPFVTDMPSGQFSAFRSFGCAVGSNQRAFNGAMSDIFMSRGIDFPLDGGSPDLTVIQNLANRTTSINSFVAAGNRRFYFPLTTGTDLSDAWGVAPPLTYNTANQPGANRTVYVGPNLDTNPLQPRRTVDQVSQVTFGTPRDPATAFTTIGSDSGTYTGITPNNIQARLIDAITGAEVHARRVVDPAPSGGTWAENPNAFTSVPMRAGYMLIQYRAYDASDVPLTDWATAWSFRGAGMNIYMQGQSGAAVPIKQGTGMFLESSVIGNVITVTGNLPVAGLTVPAGGLSFAVDVNSTIGNSSPWASDFKKGPAQLMRELDLLHPGVPTSFVFFGDGGIPLFYWKTGGELNGRYQAFKDAAGVRQPYLFFHMAHNAAPGAEYNETLENVFNHVVSLFGTPVRALHTSTGRGPVGGMPAIPNTFAVASDTSATSQELISLYETIDYCNSQNTAAPYLHWWFSSDETTQSIFEDTAVADSHTANTLLGGGRWGTSIFYACASGCRMIPDVPMRMVMKADGADVVIEFVPDVVL